MYESPQAEILDTGAQPAAIKAIRITNVAMLALIGAMIVKVAIFSGQEIGVGFRIFTSFVFVLFTAPYFLCLKAFSSPPKLRKSAIFSSAAWCIFVVVGALGQEHDFLTYVICVIFILVSISNIFFLTKLGGSKVA